MALSTRSSPQTIGVTRARQGRLGRNILWVLVVALLLVVLGFLATWTWKARDFANAPNQGQAPASAAQTFNAPQPGGAARQNYTTGGAYAPTNHGNPDQPNRSKTTTP